MTNYLKKLKSKAKFVGDREEFLIQLCQKKRVVHIGCTDWPDSKEQDIKGKLLHSRISSSSESVIGVDIDDVGIQEFRARFPKDTFLLGDISSNPKVVSEIIKFRPDLILIPDVIEHIENAKEFLDGVYRLISTCEESTKPFTPKVVISTPNAYSLKTFLPILVNYDVTHLDHCSIHNEVTLAHLTNESKLVCGDMLYASRSIRARYGVLASVVTKPIDFICKFLPRLSDTLIVFVSQNQTFSKNLSSGSKR